MNQRISRYFHFSQKERKDFLITGIVLGFILFFFVWRTTDYNLIQGIVALLQFMIISLGSLFIFVSASKIIAILRGYEATYSAWITASLIGFVVSFTTYGLIPLLFPGLIEIQAIKRLRHGKYFEGENKYDIFTSLAVAPLTVIFVSIFSQFFFAVTRVDFFYYLMIFNAFLAFFSLLPFTKNIGLHIFYVNKTRYVFLLFFSLGFLILTLANIFFSAVFAVIVAGLLWVLTRNQLKDLGI